MAMLGNVGKGRGRGRYRPMAEINVTPLVDVMLVLLIVFMVTAPLITHGVNVNLPQANAKPVADVQHPQTITVDAQGQVYLNDDKTPIPLNTLVAVLQQASQGDQTQQIFVKGDNSVSYGDMLNVMATITNGGFSKVALLAKQPDPASSQ